MYEATEEMLYKLVDFLRFEFILYPLPACFELAAGLCRLLTCIFHIHGIQWRYLRCSTLCGEICSPRLCLLGCSAFTRTNINRHLEKTLTWKFKEFLCMCFQTTGSIKTHTIVLMVFISTANTSMTHTYVRVQMHTVNIFTDALRVLLSAFLFCNVFSNFRITVIILTVYAHV